MLTDVLDKETSSSTITGRQTQDNRNDMGRISTEEKQKNVSQKQPLTVCICKNDSLKQIYFFVLSIYK